MVRHFSFWCSTLAYVTLQATGLERCCFGSCSAAVRPSASILHELLLMSSSVWAVTYSPILPVITWRGGVMNIGVCIVKRSRNLAVQDVRLTGVA